MFLPSLSIKRPVLTIVANLLLVLLGLASIQRLAVRQYPDIDKPQVSITTTYTGASSGVVETEITQPIEAAISGIEGIRLIESTSQEERSQINIEFTLDRDIDFAASDVRDAVARIANRLPREADNPVVRKASGNTSPMMYITLSSTRLDQLQLTDFAERNLVDPISVVPGVASVTVGGARRYAMRVWLDRQAMTAYGITAADVTQRLSDENIELPSGRLESLNRELTVRTTTRFETKRDFEELVIKTVGLTQVRLRDIANVEIGAENYRTAYFVDGKPAVGLGVVRQSKSNIVAVSSAVRGEVEKLRSALPRGTTLEYSYDESLFIKASIKEVVSSLLIAFLLVVLVILLFLRSWISTLIPSLAIPISIIATITVMQVLGFSINVLTLLAAVLAIGIVVDDAIVMLENIHRRFDEGESALVAAYNGSRQVGFAIVATTLVLVSVFVPISFLQGTVGRLFTEFGITLAAAVLFSAFVSLTLTPMLCSQILRRGKRSKNIVARTIERLLQWVETAYGRSLAWSLRHKGVVILATLGVSGLAYFLYRVIPEELAPVEDRGIINTPITAPQGATLGYTVERVKEVEAVFKPFRGESGPIRQTIASVAPGFGGAAPVNTARVLVRLKDWDERKEKQQDVVRAVFPKLLALPGARAFAVNPASLGLGFGEPINYVIGGADHQTVEQWADVVVNVARENPGLMNLRADYDNTKPQVVVTVDRARAADLGISVNEIGQALQVMLGGEEVTKYTIGDEQYEVIVQAAAEDRREPSDLASIYVRSSSGALVPLGSLVTMETRGTPTSLNRVNRQASVTITGSLAAGYSIGEALKYLDSIVEQNLPRNAVVSYLGQSKEFRESSRGLYMMFGFALVIVFLVLAAQFESFIHPLIILIAVPLATTGGLAALYLTGVSLNIYSEIGMILLVGLMAKNGILIVEFANQLRDAGRTIEEAAYEAARIRFRPIVMTSVSTVLGAVPLALASGAGAEGREAIGNVVIGGVSLATFMTLFIIPVLYVLFARFTKPTGTIERALRDELSEKGAVSEEEGEPVAEPAPVNA